MSRLQRTGTTRYRGSKTVNQRYRQILAADTAFFDTPLTNTVLSNYALGDFSSFTRASTAKVKDHEGLLKTALSGEIRFHGARRVENLLTYSNDFANAAWTVTNCTKNGVVAGVGPNGEDAYSVSFTGGVQGVIGQTITPWIGSYTVSVWVRTESGTSSIRLLLSGGGGGFSPDISISETWQRISYTSTTNLSGTTIGIYSNVAKDTGTVYILKAQLENVTGQVNQNPSEYVSTNVLASPYHGANVDGVKYFSTENGNTVTSNVVTEGTGVAISSSVLLGYLGEVTSTNLVTYSENFSDASWTSNYCTLTGASIASPDGTLTGTKMAETTGVNPARVHRNTTITGEHTWSIYVKDWAGDRFIGMHLYIATDNWEVVNFNPRTGAMTQTGSGSSSTFTGVSYKVETLANGWFRYSLTATAPAASLVYNLLHLSDTGTPTYTSQGYPTTHTGDITKGVYIWGGQHEALGFPSSYKPTSGATASRSADVLQYSRPDYISGSSVNNLKVQFTLTPNNITSGIIFATRANGGLERYVAFINPSGLFIFRKTVGGTAYEAQSDSAVVVGTSYEVECRSDTTNGVRLYVDGVLQAISSSNTSSPDFTTSPSNIFIGSNESSLTQMNSTVRDFRISEI